VERLKNSAEGEGRKRGREGECAKEQYGSMGVRGMGVKPEPEPEPAPVSEPGTYSFLLAVLAIQSILDVNWKMIMFY